MHQIKLETSETSTREEVHFLVINQMFLARRILLDQQDLLSIECLYLAISQVVVGFQKQIKNLWTPFTGRKLAFCSRLHSGSKRILNYQNNIHVKHDSVSISSSLLHQGKYTEFIGHNLFNRNSTGQLSQETHFGHVLET